MFLFIHVPYSKHCLADRMIFFGMSLRNICLSACLFLPSVRLPLSFPLPLRLSVHLCMCVSVEGGGSGVGH